MKNIDLSAISYTHRFKGASLLISKANRLSGMPSPGQSDQKDQHALVAALAFYDMALSLLKPYDPNYATVMNWKCNVLVALHQYEDAVAWYREIVRISEETDGKAKRNATAVLAQEMVEKYVGQKNGPLTTENKGHANFDEPPYCMYAEEFCLLLAEKKFKKAHSCLAPSLQESVSASKLKTDWLAMVGKTNVEELEISLQQNTLEWPSRKADEIGWCYFSISGGDFSEAVTLVIAQTPYNGFWISAVEFGRP